MTKAINTQQQLRVRVFASHQIPAYVFIMWASLAPRFSVGHTTGPIWRKAECLVVRLIENESVELRVVVCVNLDCIHNTLHTCVHIWIYFVCFFASSLNRMGHTLAWLTLAMNCRKRLHSQYLSIIYYLYIDFTSHVRFNIRLMQATRIRIDGTDKSPTPMRPPTTKYKDTNKSTWPVAIAACQRKRARAPGEK